MMNTIANALRQAAELPALPLDYAELLELIAAAAEAERDDSDPMQLRRDVRLIVGIMQSRYGEQAIPMAERIAERLGKMAFARVVVSSLKRREREALRGRALSQHDGRRARGRGAKLCFWIDPRSS